MLVLHTWQIVLGISLVSAVGLGRNPMNGQDKDDIDRAPADRDQEVPV